MTSTWPGKQMRSIQCWPIGADLAILAVPGSMASSQYGETCSDVVKACRRTIALQAACEWTDPHCSGALPLLQGYNLAVPDHNLSKRPSLKLSRDFCCRILKLSQNFQAVRQPRPSICSSQGGRVKLNHSSPLFHMNTLLRTNWMSWQLLVGHR